MNDFKKAIEKKGNPLGHRKTNSDEALGVNFKDAETIRLAEIKIKSLEINPYQPRSKMDEEKLEELKNSILERGLLQPIIVCPFKNDSKRFQIIAGHRRTEAMRRLEKEFIPAIIIKDQSQDLQIDSLIENIQRDDLSPLDIAFAIKRIMEDSNIKQIDISKMLGKSKGYISQLIKLCELPQRIIEHQANNSKISMTILSQISYIENEKIQMEVFTKACEEEMSRVEVKNLIDNLLAKTKVQKNKNKSSATGKSFIYKANKKSISFKLDLTNVDACEEAIKELETLLEQLKNQKV